MKKSFYAELESRADEAILQNVSHGKISPNAAYIVRRVAEQPVQVLWFMTKIWDVLDILWVLSRFIGRLCTEEYARIG